jgi:hypothetical protein
LRRGEFFLFPDSDRGAATGGFTDIFSKRFRRYRDEKGLDDAQRDFHGGRTSTWASALGPSTGPRGRLMGHAGDDVTGERYEPESETMQVRKEYVDRVDRRPAGRHGRHRDQSGARRRRAIAPGAKPSTRRRSRVTCSHLRLELGMGLRPSD